MTSFIYFRWNFNLNRIYQSGFLTRLTLLVLAVDVLSPTTWIGVKPGLIRNVSTFCYVMNSPMWIFYLSVAARTTWHVYGRSQSARRLQKTEKSAGRADKAGREAARNFISAFLRSEREIILHHSISCLVLRAQMKIMNTTYYITDR